jgi:hypothetical protein
LNNLVKKKKSGRKIIKWDTSLEAMWWIFFIVYTKKELVLMNRVNMFLLGNYSKHIFRPNHVAPN